MPRQAASDFAIPATPAGERLRPPRDLDKPEAALFVSIVLAHPANHFNDAHAVLLAAYCRACIDEEVSSAELRVGGYVIDGKPSPWLSILKEARRSMTTLCRSLRLSPASRVSSASEEPNVSYYTKMALMEEGHRDDN